MLRSRIWVVRRALLLAALPLIFSSAVSAQVTICTSGSTCVALLRGKPFTGEFVSTSVMPSSDGMAKTTIRKGRIARDSQGRTRIERNGAEDFPMSQEQVTLHTRDGESFNVTRRELDVLIMIHDPTTGKVIQIQPGLRIARVTPTGTAELASPHGRPYRDPLFSLLGAKKIPPQIQLKELGYREINGVQAEGLRTITLGKEDDGEWQGKPVNEDEAWSSEDLGATVLRIRKDFRKGTESREELINIKLEEPDPALFEIPPGYKVNPRFSEDMPYSLPDGQVSRQPAREPR